MQGLQTAQTWLGMERGMGMEVRAGRHGGTGPERLLRQYLVQLTMEWNGILVFRAIDSDYKKFACQTKGCNGL
jgi:hypothetical protein